MWGATNAVCDRPEVKIFQSTHPCGVRLVQLLLPLNHTDFNPRTHVGCDSANRNAQEVAIISIHAPMWGATSWGNAWNGMFFISIHAPMWGATPFDLATALVYIFQSTHPCGVRLDHPGFISGVKNISIHAPMWGATSSRFHSFAFQPISIHAPMWGATVGTYEFFERRTISIHAPMWGATPTRLRWTIQRNQISIHAPMWGATKIRKRNKPRIGISIHAPMWGATSYCLR